MQSSRSSSVSSTPNQDVGTSLQYRWSLEGDRAVLPLMVGNRFFVARRRRQAEHDDIEAELYYLGIPQICYLGEPGPYPPSESGLLQFPVHGSLRDAQIEGERLVNSGQFGRVSPLATPGWDNDDAPLLPIGERQNELPFSLIGALSGSVTEFANMTLVEASDILALRTASEILRELLERGAS